MNPEAASQAPQELAKHPAPPRYRGVPLVMFVAFVALALLAELAGYFGWGL